MSLIGNDLNKSREGEGIGEKIAEILVEFEKKTQYDCHPEAFIKTIIKATDQAKSAILSVFKEMVEKAEPEKKEEQHLCGGEYCIICSEMEAIAEYKANLLKMIEEEENVSTS